MGDSDLPWPVAFVFVTILIKSMCLPMVLFRMNSLFVAMLHKLFIECSGDVMSVNSPDRSGSLMFKRVLI